MSSLDKEIWEVPESEKDKRIEGIKFHYTGDKPISGMLIALANTRVENFVEENKDDPKIADLYDKYIQADSDITKIKNEYNEKIKELYDIKNHIWNQLFELSMKEEQSIDNNGD